eukprot:CAMPEP_0206187522 /NCGR_PEP_ID=MMETSP0166-20121206/3049_1 /ASSEMBLY_ACC=CAM_ASM_000260 /TAXON_ID=95228 /ORGANISM="Vannella robusta, Strain DIVA3 518/3/11/1/6" /LENGTH=66 /DNA_ID=CAMNT_0053603115 /DNA_START=58 /DNA_END=258 /DNA_ORIENTATION=+
MAAKALIISFALITHDIILEAKYECSRSYFLNNALTLPPELAETMAAKALIISWPRPNERSKFLPQ